MFFFQLQTLQHMEWNFWFSIGRASSSTRHRLIVLFSRYFSPLYNSTYFLLLHALLLLLSHGLVCSCMSLHIFSIYHHHHHPGTMIINITMDRSVGWKKERKLRWNCNCTYTRVESRESLEFINNSFFFSSIHRQDIFVYRERKEFKWKAKIIIDFRFKDFNFSSFYRDTRCIYWTLIVKRIGGKKSFLLCWASLLIPSPLRHLFSSFSTVVQLSEFLFTRIFFFGRNDARRLKRRRGRKILQ